MSKTKHTPGPWAVNGNRVESEHEHGWANDGWIICDCNGPDGEANARLIAAAPEMMEALARLLAEIDGMTGYVPAISDLIGSTNWVALRQRRDEARAALRKASAP